MKNTIYDKETFLKVIKILNVPSYLDLDFFYDVYQAVSETIINVMNSTEGYSFTPLNPVTVILYILNEYVYSTIKIDNDLIDISDKSVEEFINLLNSYINDDEEEYPTDWKKWKLGEKGYPEIE